jgi:hypothetical protein
MPAPLYQYRNLFKPYYVFFITMLGTRKTHTHTLSRELDSKPFGGRFVINQLSFPGPQQPCRLTHDHKTCSPRQNGKRRLGHGASARAL